MKESALNEPKKVLTALALLAASVLGYSVPAIWAAPSISGVQGSVSNGQSITISGSGFGTTGPTIQIFDDFEKGTNGNVVSTAAGSAQINQWAVSAEGTYSTDYAQSGTKGSKMNFNYSSEFPRIQKSINVGSGGEVFLSWWAYMPTNTSIPGTNGPEGGGPNWKLFWLFGTPFPKSDYVITFLSNNSPISNSQFTQADDPFGNNGPNMWCSDYNASYYYTSKFHKGTWTRYMVWMKGGQSNNGGGAAWEVNSYGFNAFLCSAALPSEGCSSTYTQNNLTTQSTGNPWTTVGFPGFGRKDTSSVAYYDDIYVATSSGPGAHARVEIGNNATYTSCTNLAITTPTSWSDTQVVTTIRQGGFKSGDTAYLFVIDANGNVNSQGYPVTISNTMRPSPPQNLRIVN